MPIFVTFILKISVDTDVVFLATVHSADIPIFEGGHLFEGVTYVKGPLI